MRWKVAVLTLAGLGGMLSGPSAVSAALGAGFREEMPAATCGVIDPDPDLAESIEKLTAILRPKALAVKPVRIPVAFHVITSGKEGRVTDKQIKATIKSLNWGFRGSPFSFYLSRTNRTNNPAWYADCGPGSDSELQMKSRLANDPKHVLNIYTCKPYEPARQSFILGYAVFPFTYDEASGLHGVVLHPAALPGGSYGPAGRLVSHEVGHYLGLYHIWTGGCTGNGDFVADTPPQADSHDRTCPAEIDTCLDDAGPDDVPNFMNYSTDTCMEHFSPGQVDRMIDLTGTYRPSLVPW